MSHLLLINPRPRKGSAAAKAKMARLRSMKKSSPKKRRRATTVVVRANPAPRRARRARVHAVARHSPKRRYKRNPIRGLSMGSISAMAKGAAIGAGGALVTDLAFGYGKSFLPVSMQTPVNLSTGAMNPMYFLAKAGVAIALGLLGKKVTKHAGTMAEGALTVNAYEVIKSMVPASVSLGNYSSPSAPRLSASRSTTRPSLKAYSAPSMVPASTRDASRMAMYNR